jgi:ubiquinone/menaquinone biosynthesis C-methylase UbiE
MPSSASPRPSPQQESLARVYEEDIYPLVEQKLADLLIYGLSLPPRAHVLQIGCGLGTATAELLGQLDANSRLVAVETSQAFVERARGNVPPEHLGRRVFFRALDLASRLPFANSAFDLVLANVALADHPSPAAFLAEAARVAKPGSVLRLATLVTGTWREFLDVYSDVLLRLRRTDSVEALQDYAKAFPEPEALAGQIEAAGFAKVEVDTTHWELVFRTSREFFYAPVIERGPLDRWKAIAGKGPVMRDTFVAVKQAIDTYFGGGAFSVSLVGGRFQATKRKQ